MSAVWTHSCSSTPVLLQVCILLEVGGSPAPTVFNGIAFVCALGEVFTMRILQRDKLDEFW